MSPAGLLIARPRGIMGLVVRLVALTVAGGWRRSRTDPQSHGKGEQRIRPGQNEDSALTRVGWGASPLAGIFLCAREGRGSRPCWSLQVGGGGDGVSVAALVTELDYQIGGRGVTAVDPWECVRGM